MMNIRTIALMAATVIVVGSGCSDDSGITYPTGNGGWQVGLTLSEIPPRMGDVPVIIEVQGDAINLTTGARSPDGAVLVFCSSGGSYPNGSSEIELGTVDGRAVTELVISLPGTYEVEVTYPDEMASASAVFSIGLE
jgi:hypothetical protein